MRLATSNSYDATIANLQRRQADLSESQLQLTSGKRVNRASDDPTAAARAERALALEQRSTATQRAVDASRNAMTLGEGALGDAVDLMQQAREALVSAGNASYSDAERKGIAASLRNLRGQLLAVANRSDGTGGYLFGGQGSSAPPFVDTPTGVQFQGTAGQTAATTGSDLPLSIDGPSAWQAARTGNGVFETRATVQAGNAWIDSGNVTNPSALTGQPYSITFAVSGGATTYTVLENGNPTVPPMNNVPYQSGAAVAVDGMSVNISGTPANGDRFDLVPSTPTLSVFDTLDRAAAALETPGRNSGQVAQTVNSALRDMDAVLSQASALRSKAGDALNRIDGVESRLSATKLSAQSDRSAAEDLDMVAAISRFQSQQTGYDAALKSYSMVQRLSLFQYING